MAIEEIKFIVEKKNGTYRIPVKMEKVNGKIEFPELPFTFKDEIKAMQGSHWCGYDPTPRQIWTVKDCKRNWFQLDFLMGNDPYAWWDQPIKEWDYERPLMAHQRLLANSGLTFHYHIFAAEMGTGKTLAAFEVMEKSQKENWYWVGPLKSLKAIEREMKKWGLRGINLVLVNYEKFVTIMDEWGPNDIIPHGIIFDESSRLKNYNSQRSRAAQKMADLIRDKWDKRGYVILMSGTPSPKSPVDWWSQAEIVCPGFLKEGSDKALEYRLAHFVDQKLPDGVTIKKRLGWRDSEDKCDECGYDRSDVAHDRAGEFDFDGDVEHHDFVTGVNEVNLMFERLQGLVTVVHKKDCLDLPDKVYEKIMCKPKASTLRVAKALVEATDSAIKANTLLRELSDGFQYSEYADGLKACNICEGTGEVKEWFDPENPHRTYNIIPMLDNELTRRLQSETRECRNCDGTGNVDRMKRTSREVPCPKEDAFVDLLDRCEEKGRIVGFAGFVGSVDRMVSVCIRKGWAVVRCDGRGWKVFDTNGDYIPDVDPLDFWADVEGNEKVAFIGHPKSGGMGLTLVEASLMVFWSNSFAPEDRVQAEDRIHRPGMDMNRGAKIVDLIHLPSDERVLTVIRENRKLELMTMNDFGDVFGDQT